MAKGLLAQLPAEHRDRLMALSREVSFPEGKRIFEESGKADRFWVIRTGAVTLDMRVPGRQRPVVERLGPGDLLGWSWLFPPYVWHLGAEALSPVRATEFDAEAVRKLCQQDPELGLGLVRAVAEVIGRRLISARTRLLDLYAPYGSGVL